MITPLIQVWPTQWKPTNVATKILATRRVKQQYIKAETLSIISANNKAGNVFAIPYLATLKFKSGEQRQHQYILSL
jgi:hypothetical protein